MRTVQELLEVQLQQARRNAQVARAALSDPDLRRDRTKFRKMLNDNVQLQNATAAELSKFANLK
ncbi:hypothetical protein [Methyloversatilis universalis]|uniref:hypothetical protein n=1 Tax=Methyloversatilis universalis TaxID=378211 RepID=UPI00036111E1|nr:hypothetical protein [Methyloversatilis universalis]